MARGSKRAVGQGFRSTSGGAVSVSTTPIAGAIRFMKSLEKDLSPTDLSKVTKAIGKRFLRLVKDATPVGLTGRVKAAWRLETRSGTEIAVINDNPVISFLEFGTEAHGPVRARALFIPLTKQAVIEGYRTGMEFGEDFILTKKVKGIRALRMVQMATSKLPSIIREEGEAFLSKKIPRNVRH